MKDYILSIVIAGSFILSGVSFMGGAYIMSEHWEKKVAEARADQGRKDYAKLVRALDQTADLRERLDSNRSEFDRVRKSYESRLRRASATASEADAGADPRCERLLRESVDLLQEARSALERNAASHDALVKVVAP